MNWGYLLVSALLLLGCSSTSQNISSKKESSSFPQDSVSISKHAFIKGLDFESRGIKASIFMYKKALEFDPTSKFLHFRIVQSYLNNSVDSAYVWAKKAISLEGENKTEWLLLTAGMHSYYKNDDEAEKLLILAIEQDPTSQHALYELMRIYESKRDFSKLQPILEGIVRKAGYPKELIEKFLLVTAINKDLDSQIKMLRELWLETGDNQWAIQLGQALLMSGNNEEAATVLYEVAKTEPNNVELKVRLAQLKQEVGDNLAAAELFSSLYKPQTGEGIEYLTRASGILLDGNHLEEAYEKLKFVNENDSTSGLAPYFMSIYFSKKNKYQEAIEWVNVALSRDTVNTRFVHHKSYIYTELGDYNTANSLMDSLLLKQDKNEVALYYSRLLGLQNDRQRFDSLGNVQRNEKRLALMKKVFGRDPENKEVVFEIGTLYERLKKYDKANEIFVELIDSDSNYHEALNYWGYTLVEQEIDVERGGLYIDKALKLDPNNSSYLDSWSWYLFKTGKVEEALVILLKVFESGDESVKSDPILLEHIAECYRALGRSEESLEFLKKAVENTRNENDVPTTP